MIYSMNYTVAEAPWWVKYPKPRSVKKLVDEINEAKQIIEMNKTEEYSEYYEDFANNHRISYLREVLIGENGVSEETTLNGVENLLASKNSGKLENKAKNFANALKIYFPDIFSCSFNARSFTPKLISEIHEIIGKGLIPNAGKHRTLWSMPAQEDWEYLNPRLIENSLEMLCKFVVEQLEKKGDLLFVTKLAATFMTHFLHIHPFSNGNGRVARIAVSLILSCHTVVPIALFCSVNSRNTYHDCLRESRSYPVTFVASALARLILESIWSTNWNIVYSLELSP